VGEEGVERKLTTILAADVVGYSRLMAADEAGTLAQLKTHRKELIEPKTAEYHGRVVKLIGDGTLMEFGSVVDAVHFAVDVQQTLAERNAKVPEDRRITYRIGINLGEIIVDDEDIYGDGVNIAARLEGLAEPGGIFISGKVYEEVRNKLPTTFEDLGEQVVKNIPEPVRVYRVTNTDRSATPITTTDPPLPDKPSIAVLPFVNMSGDTEQEYFSDGISEDIITELSRFRSLFVIARNSSFHYRGQSPRIQEVGRELGVQYLVEGSVRKAGNRVRITAQLVESKSGNHLWAERYDRDIQDLFAVQDEVTQAIAATIEGRMAASGAQRSRRKPTGDLVAYDYFLQGRENIERLGDLEVSIQLLQRAIELDPEFAQAHAWLSRTYITLYHDNFRSETLREALDLARRAVLLDESDAWCHAAVGFAYLFGGQHDLAGVHLDRAVALNPTDSRVTSFRALWLAFMGKTDEAVPIIDHALRRDPFISGPFWTHLCTTLFQARRYEEAIRAISHVPKPNRWDLFYLTASYAHLGQIEQAQTCADELQREYPNFSLGQVELTERYKDPADVERLLDGLRKAGLPE
jgi:TolB-like protein/Tfp pilus assembly protein PilF